MRKNKKMIAAYMIIIIFICGFSFNSYADSIFSYPFWDYKLRCPNYALGAVSINDVLEWHKEFQNGSQTTGTFDEFFKTKSVPLLQTVNGKSYRYSEDMFVDGLKVWSASIDEYYAVFDENGEYTYTLSSMVADVNGDGPYIKSCASGKFINLSVSSTEELQKFLENEQKWKQEAREKCSCAQMILDESEYLGCYAEYGKLCISLVNQEKRKELEELGFTCITTTYSRSQAYHDIKKLWEKREELGILGIRLNVSDMFLEICGQYTGDMFWYILGEEGKQIPIYYCQGMWQPEAFCELERFYLWNSEAALKVENIIKKDMENPEYFVENMYLGYVDSYVYIRDDAHIDEKQWDRLQTALTQMKEQYPEYSCKNIYYHIIGDCDADAYMNFDSELLEFVNMLPVCATDKNVIVEMEFGDPQRIELKRMLRQYKEKFPEMSYDEIYRIYIKDMEENTQISKEEKLYWYLWKKYSGEVRAVDIKSMETENTVDTTADKQLFYPAVIGFGILVISSVVIVKIKKK